MTRLLTLGLAILLVHCTFDPAKQTHVDAADALTAASGETLTAHAAGDDCAVLLIRTKTVLDDAAVEAMHYGAGDAADGGLRRFAEERQFRAVVYTDADDRIWTYGSITRQEARSMPSCR